MNRPTMHTLLKFRFAIATSIICLLIAACSGGGGGGNDTGSGAPSPAPVTPPPVSPPPATPPPSTGTPPPSTGNPTSPGNIPAERAVLNVVTAPNWKACSPEFFGGCAFEGLREIRYGTDGKWRTKTYLNSFPGWECSAGNFGGDPAPGEAKRCEVSDVMLTGTIAAPRVCYSGAMCPEIDLAAIGNLLQRIGFALPVVDVEPLTVRYGDWRTLVATAAPPDGLLVTGTLRGDPPQGEPERYWNSLAVINPQARIVGSSCARIVSGVGG